MTSTDRDRGQLAMQLAVRVEKSAPPSVDVIHATCALATIALLDDERAQPGGPWHAEVAAWNGARIRKLVRRGRGAAWTSAQTPPGVTIELEGVQVRAYVPGPLNATPPELAKLQIQSSELAAPNVADTAPENPGLMIAVTPLVAMSWGKAAAQCAHAAQRAWMTATPYRLAAWEATGRAVTVIHPGPELWAELETRATTHIHDGGFTEIPAGTLTTLACWTAGP